LFPPTVLPTSQDFRLLARFFWRPTPTYFLCHLMHAFFFLCAFPFVPRSCPSRPDGYNSSFKFKPLVSLSLPHVVVEEDSLNQELLSAPPKRSNHSPLFCFLARFFTVGFFCTFLFPQLRPPYYFLFYLLACFSAPITFFSPFSFTREPYRPSYFLSTRLGLSDDFLVFAIFLTSVLFGFRKWTFAYIIRTPFSFLIFGAFFESLWRTARRPFSPVRIQPH